MVSRALSSAAGEVANVEQRLEIANVERRIHARYRDGRAPGDDTGLQTATHYGLVRSRFKKYFKYTKDNYIQRYL